MGAGRELVIKCEGRQNQSRLLLPPIPSCSSVCLSRCRHDFWHMFLHVAFVSPLTGSAWAHRDMPSATALPAHCSVDAALQRSGQRHVTSMCLDIPGLCGQNLHGGWQLALLCCLPCALGVPRSTWMHASWAVWPACCRFLPPAARRNWGSQPGASGTAP